LDARVNEDRWERLLRLLGPIHEQAAGTARRLSKSADEGDDLYQESVLRAFERLHDLRDESKFRSWFFATLLSIHRTRRRRRATVSLEEAWPRGGEPAGEDGSKWAEALERADRAARALDGLAPVQREAVVLHEIEGFSVEEVAAMQGVTISAVKSRLVRGRDKLRQFYERIMKSARIPGLRRENEPARELAPEGEIR